MSAKSYGLSVDIWSVGYIFAELMLCVPYVPGDTDIDQLAKIFQARVTLKLLDWSDYDCLPAYAVAAETL